MVEFSRQCCESAVYVTRSWDWRKPFSCYFSLINFSYWAKKVWFFWLNVAAGFLKLHPTCPEEQWIEEDFFNWSWILSSDIEVKQGGLLAETFRQGCQNCNLNFKKTSPLKFVFCHCSLKNFWSWAKNSQLFM